MHSHDQFLQKHLHSSQMSAIRLLVHGSASWEIDEVETVSVKMLTGNSTRIRGVCSLVGVAAARSGAIFLAIQSPRNALDSCGTSLPLRSASTFQRPCQLTRAETFGPW